METQNQEAGSNRGAVLARSAAAAALIAAVVLIFVVLLGGDSGTKYKLVFQNGGQLVPGNEVLVAGQPIGLIDQIDLTGEGLAEVDVTVDAPLHEGSTAIVRSTSLSGIANRYISVAPGPDNSPELEDGATLTTEETTAPVDLDQLFNTLDKDARKGLQDVIQGSAAAYTGNYEQANDTYKYFAPSLQSTQRLLAELTRDQRSFEQFLVTGSSVLGAVAERRDDLSALTENANVALGAIASENEALDRSLAGLPPAMRQGNTTFVNLRAALDDLDPLVETSKTATKDLPAFLRDLRPVANDAVPVVRNLRLTVDRNGPHNDLTEILRDAPEVRSRAKRASDTSVQAMDDTQDEVELFRPYTPDFTAFISKLGQVTSYYDANGHYARVLPASSNVFTYNEAGDPAPDTGTLDPIYNTPAAQDDFFQTILNALRPFGYDRCPGAGTQAASDASSPFLDDGNLAGECNPNLPGLVLPGLLP